VVFLYVDRASVWLEVVWSLELFGSCELLSQVRETNCFCVCEFDKFDVLHVKEIWTDRIELMCMF